MPVDSNSERYDDEGAGQSQIVNTNGKLRESDFWSLEPDSCALP